MCKANDQTQNHTWTCWNMLLFCVFKQIKCSQADSVPCTHTHMPSHAACLPFIYTGNKRTHKKELTWTLLQTHTYNKTLRWHCVSQWRSIHFSTARLLDYIAHKSTYFSLFNTLSPSASCTSQVSWLTALLTHIISHTQSNTCCETYVNVCISIFPN